MNSITQKGFYSKLRMYCLEDVHKQIARYNKLSNSISKCCLGYRSPDDVLSDYLAAVF